MIAAGSVNPHDTRTIARTAVLSDEKNADESDVTDVPRRRATMTRERGIAQTMSLAMDGEVSSGTPDTVRDAGAVGSEPSDTLDPAVPNCFNVLIFNTVAGLATNVSTVVSCCSAVDFANSNASRFDQLSPASAAVG